MAAPAKHWASGNTWNGLVDRVHDDVLWRRMVARWSERGSYRDVLLDTAGLSGGWPPAPLIRGLRERRPPRPDDDVHHWHVNGAMRANQGVSASDMMHGWRVYHAELRTRARELLAEEADGAGRSEILLEFVELSAAWVDLAMIATNDGHREAEMERHRHADHFVSNLVRGVLHGAVSPSELRDGAEALGLGLAGTFRAVRAHLSPGASVPDLEGFLRSGPGHGRNGIVALLDGDVCGFVRDLPAGAAPTVIGASEPVPVQGLAAAFVEASRALSTAAALGSTAGVHTFRSLGVSAAVLADRAVGELLLDRYIAPFEAQGESGEATLETVRCYIEHDARLKVIAEEYLFLHANSVRYRISRFEETTGCSLRRHDDLVEVWWAFRYRELQGRLRPAR